MFEGEFYDIAQNLFEVSILFRVMVNIDYVQEPDTCIPFRKQANRCSTSQNSVF